MATRRTTEIKWTKTKYNLKKFLKHYQLPRIVTVVSGWCGADEHETISRGQILRVDRKFNQQRVVAEDELGRHISIPTNYRFRFNVIPANEDINKSFTIEDILTTFTLPQTIQMSTDDGMCVSVDGAKKAGYRFGVLKLLRTHEISYLVCNSMNSGGIVKQPLVIPMYITIELVVAEGLVKGTKKQWENYQRVRSQIVESHVNLENVTGIEDISIYGSVEVSVKRKANLKEKINIYEEIEPKIVHISTARDKDKTAEEVKDAVATSLYEDIIEIPEERPQRPTSFQDGNYASLVSELQGQYQKLNRLSLMARPPPALSESTYDVIGKDNDNRPTVPPKPKLSMTSPSRKCFDPSSATPEPPKLQPRAPVPAQLFSPRPEIKTKPVQVCPIPTNGANKSTKFPTDLRGLGVEQVSDCLRALNLGQYVRNFEENDVDGELLLGLTADVLEDDLEMSPLHAIKLDKFIKGWRPK